MQPDMSALPDADRMVRDWPALSQSDLVRNARRSARRIQSADGEWLIFELLTSPLDPRGALALIFESDFAMRILCNYPRDWSSLSDGQLLALGWAV